MSLILKSFILVVIASATALTVGYVDPVSLLLVHPSYLPIELRIHTTSVMYLLQR